LKEKEDHKDLKKFKANEEKFLTFASKRHPNHPTYADYIKKQRLKKQKHGENHNEKHMFNSPTPKNKENIENQDASIITD
jgi:hypothetical protein